MGADISDLDNYMIARCDLLVTAQIMPLDYWDHCAETSATTHNNPH